MLYTRPKVAELAFQLFGRSLHPELFRTLQSRHVRRGQYEATIDITSAGHLVTWRCGGTTLTEVCTAANNPLPSKRLLFAHPLRGASTERVEYRGGIVYNVRFELEPVAPEVFWVFQEELAGDSEREGMMHTFGASGRMALGAISYINVETRDRSLVIQAFHTFPDDYAIVKSQSSFELP